MKRSNMDELISVLGKGNRFQVFVLILLAVNYIPLVFNHVIMAFYGSTPVHKCQIASGSTGLQGPNSTRPSAGMYQNDTVLEELREGCSSRLYLNSGVNITVQCKKGQWKYLAEFGESTIVTEWDLVCDDKRYGSLATTIYFCGVMVGGLLFGFLSDRYGRLPVLLFTLYVHIAFGVGLSFAPTYAVFVILRFIIGVLMQGLQTSCYVEAMEFFLPAKRPMVGIIIECFWGTSVMMLAGLAYLLPNWRHLQLVITLPSVVAICYICLLPESLRWLLMKGKLDRAESLVLRISRCNKIEFPAECWDLVKKEIEIDTETTRTNYNFLHLILTPKLRQRTLVLFYVWQVLSFRNVVVLTIATGYYGLTFMITSLPGNKYLNFFIGGAVETLAYASSLFVMNRFGRKLPLLAYFLIAGVCCITASVIPRTTDSGVRLEIVSTVFAIAGRFAAAGLFSIIFVYTTELYPTVIRNIGMGTCTVWARLGGVIAPQINQAGLSASTSINVSILVFGCMMMVGGFFLLLLPETHGKKLPDSISDVEVKRMVSSNNVVTVATSKVELWTPGMEETENTYM